MLSQGFGQNVAWYKEKLGHSDGHRGLDWPCIRGTEIYASHDGLCTSASKDSFGGLFVTLKDGDYETIYGHFYEFKVKKGQSVKRGQVVGLANSSGLSTSDHLHYGLRIKGKYTDPSPYLVWNVKIGAVPMNKTQIESLVVDTYLVGFNRLPTSRELNHWVQVIIRDGLIGMAEFMRTAKGDRSKLLAS